ncbi:MAG: class I SAM-dependent methyltransferase [Candidatus Wallbacteria bacterium]|nr:class I SAM-dependent methyltransferase [Candidatus Wallbacteria bacterium]
MLYKYLPYCIFRRFFGDRKKYGLTVDPRDKDFIEYRSRMWSFYRSQQKGFLGNLVSRMGFRVNNLDLSGKTILEIGPGIVEHWDYNQTRPAEYYIVDVSREALSIARESLKKYGIYNARELLSDGKSIPLEDHSVDMVLTFNQLEHVADLPRYVHEIRRVLKKGGLLIGSVPTEGSLAWGIGRYLTSRRYVYRDMKLDYDKIICWEHPNFVDWIRKCLKLRFAVVAAAKRPLPFLPMDLNLMWVFVCRNDGPDT